MNESYINAAIHRFGNKGVFFCEMLSNNETWKAPLDYFDIVMANSIIHHLDDEEAALLIKLAHLSLKPGGGRLITIDSCYTENQSSFERYLLSKDRGQYTRTRDEYFILAAKNFMNVKTYIRHDLMRIPYTHIIMECVK